jgi:predicted phosphate transport protein (TIGR00153 family)
MHLFRKKEEKKVADNYAKQIEEVLKASHLLPDAKNYLINLDYESLDNLAKKLMEISNNEKQIKKENERMLYQGLLFPEDRFLFITLSEKIDKVMNKINQSVRAITERKIPLPGINFLRDSGFNEFLDLTIKSVEKLDLAIKELFVGENDVISICNEIENLEGKIDEIKLKILKEIHLLEKDLDVFTILQIEKIVHRIDEISDEAEDSSDIIILVKSLSLP